MSERVLLISSAPTHWAALTELTWATMARYAERHGYGFYTDVSDMSDHLRMPHYNSGIVGRAPLRGFRKLDLLLYFLDAKNCGKEWDYVVWLDADMLVTNYDYQLPLPVGGLVLPYDANGHNATVIIAANCSVNRDFFWACNNAGRTMFLHHSWAEMEAMRYFLQTPPYSGRTLYVSVKDLCAMPPNEYELFGLPRYVSEKYEWQLGDFSVHFSALSVEKRIELAKRWVEEYDLLP